MLDRLYVVVVLLARRRRRAQGGSFTVADSASTGDSQHPIDTDPTPEEAARLMSNAARGQSNAVRGA